jgi:MEMO1 family protein
MPLIYGAVTPHPPLIVPAIGNGEERKIAKTIAAFQTVANHIAALAPDVIVITSPHAVLYADYFHISPGTKASGTFRTFGAPQLKTEVDYAILFRAKLVQYLEASGYPAGTLGEKSPALDHGTLVPLWFLQEAGCHAPIVRIGLSGLSLAEHVRFGKHLQTVIAKSEQKVVVIASGDLSHCLSSKGPYGFTNEGPEFDRKIVDILTDGSFQKLFDLEETFCEAAGECGLRSIAILAGVLEGFELETKLQSYEGPFGVGYAVASFLPLGKNSARDYLRIFEANEQHKIASYASQEDAHVRLARQALETFVKTKKRLAIPSGLPAELLNTRSGAFVSIHKEGRLRGCIGTISPTRDNLAAEIIGNAISAGSSDPRFSPITVSELLYLDISVDVLAAPEPIESKRELDVLNYGVIVKSGRRSGLLLPNLDGVKTIDEQIAIALNKANIDPSEAYTMERFQVVRHH